MDAYPCQHSAQAFAKRQMRLIGRRSRLWHLNGSSARTWRGSRPAYVRVGVNRGTRLWKAVLQRIGDVSMASASERARMLGVRVLMDLGEDGDSLPVITCAGGVMGTGDAKPATMLGSRRDSAARTMQVRTSFPPAALPPRATARSGHSGAVLIRYHVSRLMCRSVPWGAW